MNETQPAPETTMRTTLFFSALSLLSSLLLSPRWTLFGLAVGLGLVLALAVGMGVVAFVRTVTERD